MDNEARVTQAQEDRASVNGAPGAETNGGADERSSGDGYDLVTPGLTLDELVAVLI